MSGAWSRHRALPKDCRPWSPTPVLSPRSPPSWPTLETATAPRLGAPAPQSPQPSPLAKEVDVNNDTRTRVQVLDRRLGARIAFGPALTPEAADYVEAIGYRLLLDGQDAMAALAGGCLVRLAELAKANQ